MKPRTHASAEHHRILLRLHQKISFEKSIKFRESPYRVGETNDPDEHNGTKKSTTENHGFG